MSKKTNQTKGFFGWIERFGNKLPHPVMIFMILSLVVMVVSFIAENSGLKLSYVDPKGETVEVVAKSLLSVDGFNYMLNNAVKNFMAFAPLGTVLVIVMGVGVAEWTGLIGNALKKMLSNVPSFLLSSAVVFAGVVSNLASDVGYVVIIPLGGIIFAAAGRNPIAGIAAAFAGVSGGFSANLLPGPTDALLVSISNEALKAAHIDYSMLMTANWWFLIVSTFVLTIVGAIITDKVVEPRLGKYEGTYRPDHEKLTDLELKGLKNALITLIILVVLLIYFMTDLGLPYSGMFQVIPEGKEVKDINTFLSNGLLMAIFLLFAIPGYVYGKTVGKIKNSNDLVKSMEQAMVTMASYVVLAFFAAQLIQYFNFTKLGTIIAVSGAQFLESIGLVGLPLVVGFILITAFINLFIGSASAKWAILAPIFMPMFFNLKIQPELTLMAYRIADSSTNIISPLMAYFAMVIVFVQKYDEKAGVGTLISTMLTYSLWFLLSWTLLLIIWQLTGFPLGQIALNTLQFLI